MADQDDLKSPIGWYVTAGLLAACGAALDWVLWKIAANRPDFPSQTFDYVLVGITVALLAGAAACVRIGIAFARKEAWAGKILPWVVGAAILGGVLAMAGKLAKAVLG
jgi:threonine/homoserine efflux transporter RhtA